jgi:DNA-binding response OmpR family regulator
LNYREVAVGARVLLVQSDARAGRRLAEQLAADGYAVTLALSAEHARVLARELQPMLALLGALAESSSAPATARESLALLEEIRAQHDVAADGLIGSWQRSLPVIVLGIARGELEALRAFEAGADDYVPPGTHYLELLARIGALLRRSTHVRADARTLQVGPLTVDALARSAGLAGRTLELTRMEFELLAHLAREPRRVWAREELLRSVWGYRFAGASRTVDSHASRLRRKLDPARRGGWVIAVRGVGYRLT